MVDTVNARSFSGLGAIAKLTSLAINKTKFYVFCATYPVTVELTSC